ncbi:MAG: AEC family transporter [Flavobacteriales bacterium]|nr:AEC family transporter [Flavobacteriales bacterium]
MENLLLLFVCLVIGLVLQHAKAFPPLSYKVLNSFVIYVSLPSLGLYFIPEIEISSALLYPVGVAWLGFVGSYIFFTALGRIFKWSKKLTGCLILTAGLGNTSFVGFPIVEAFFGVEGLNTAIIVDQPGTFVVFSTIGVFVASKFSGVEPSIKTISKKIFLFPPFIFFTVSIIMNLFDLHFHDMIKLVLQKLGATVTPISLISVGMQLQFNSRSKHWNFLALGLTYKLIITPLLFYLLYVLLLDGAGLVIQVSLIESAMPPMIAGTILAATYGLKPKLSSMMVGFGIPISLITMFLWYLLFKLV